MEAESRSSSCKFLSCSISSSLLFHRKSARFDNQRRHTLYIQSWPFLDTKDKHYKQIKYTLQIKIRREEEIWWCWVLSTQVCNEGTLERTPNPEQGASSKTLSALTALLPYNKLNEEKCYTRFSTNSLTIIKLIKFLQKIYEDQHEQL